jgi:outer membrane lipoprotein-sorting protein
MNMRALVVSILAFAVAPAFAADKDVEDLLKVLRDNYGKAKSVRMEVASMVLTQQGELNLKSQVWYKNPGSFRIESAGTNVSALSASDGKSAYNKAFDGKITKGKFDPDEIASPVNLEVLCFWDWKRQLSTTKGANMNESQLRLLKKETWKDKDYMVLEEKAPKSQVFVRYYIDPKTKFIVRTAVYSLEDSTLLLQDHKVTKFELNAAVDPKQLKLPS